MPKTHGHAQPAQKLSKKKPATVKQMAAMTFEPWKHGADKWAPPSNDEWVQDGPCILPYVRMAWISMFKTKAELETLIETVDAEAFDEMAAGIDRAREYFQPFLTAITGADARILCATASVAARQGSSDDGRGAADRAAIAAAAVKRPEDELLEAADRRIARL